MSQEDQAEVRRRHERCVATRQVAADGVGPDFRSDMSNFRGWPERQVYEGVEGAAVFLSEWNAVWDQWELEAEAIHDAGDKVVAIMRQRGRSKTAGTPVDMRFANIWTFDEGEPTRMEMFSGPDEALKAVGLEE